MNKKDSKLLASIILRYSLGGVSDEIEKVKECYYQEPVGYFSCIDPRNNHSSCGDLELCKLIHKYEKKRS